jgi:hypothetical protein
MRMAKSFGIFIVIHKSMRARRRNEYHEGGEFEIGPLPGSDMRLRDCALTVTTRSRDFRGKRFNACALR